MADQKEEETIRLDNEEEEDSVVDYYARLHLDRDDADNDTITHDDIKTAYKMWSSTFHPDKQVQLQQLRRRRRQSSVIEEEAVEEKVETVDDGTPQPPLPTEVQEQEQEDETSSSHYTDRTTFLALKEAYEVLSDPVLRLMYDQYGTDGVALLRHWQQQSQRHQQQHQPHQHQPPNRSGNDDDSDDDENENESRTEKTSSIYSTESSSDTDSTDEENEENNTEDDNTNGNNDDDDDDEDNDIAGDLYGRLERLLVVEQNRKKACRELQRYMDQYYYQQDVHEQITTGPQLSLNLTLPPILPLPQFLQQGKQQLQQHQQRAMMMQLPTTDGNNQQQQQQQRNLLLRAEQQRLAYQLKHVQASQKATVGVTVSCLPPPANNDDQNNRSSNRSSSRTKRAGPQQPSSKWSMAVGGTTEVVYPEAVKMAKLFAGRKTPAQHKEPPPLPQIPQQPQEQHHPQLPQQLPQPPQEEDDQATNASLFVNASYQPRPTTAVTMTANLMTTTAKDPDEDQAQAPPQQYSLGTTHTMANQTAVRYGMTYFTQSPFDDDDPPILFNLKAYRYLQGIGTTSMGISWKGTGQLLQWVVKWEAVAATTYSTTGTTRGADTHNTNKTNTNTSSPRISSLLRHKGSVKASVGVLQENALDVQYSVRFPTRTNKLSRSNWDDSGLECLIPRTIDITWTLGRLQQKLRAMIVHELTALATHPTIGFGFQHNITWGSWTWVWEFTYQQSTIRIPIPVMDFVRTDPASYYLHKLYYGVYCAVLQAVIADVLNDDDAAAGDEETKTDHYHGSPSSSGANFYRGPRKETDTEGNATAEDDDDPTGGSRGQGSSGATLWKTKIEAIQQFALMEPVADRKRKLEAQHRDGLVILHATYWLQVRDPRPSSSSSSSSSEPPEHELVSMDATKQLQFWVHERKLWIPSQLPKSCWLGFYDLRTESKFHNRRGGETSISKNTTNRNGVTTTWWWWWDYMCHTVGSFSPQRNNKTTEVIRDQPQQSQLTVRYSYRGGIFETTVGETEALSLPCSTVAERLGGANIVH